MVGPITGQVGVRDTSSLGTSAIVNVANFEPVSTRVSDGEKPILNMNHKRSIKIIVC